MQSVCQMGWGEVGWDEVSRGGGGELMKAGGEGGGMAAAASAPAAAAAHSCKVGAGPQGAVIKSAACWGWLYMAAFNPTQA